MGLRDAGGPSTASDDERRERGAGTYDARKGVTRREALGKFASGIGRFAVALPTAMVVLYCAWFVFIRGVAWGEPARRNAEREAAAYDARTVGTAPAGVVCDNENTSDTGVLHCVARVIDGAPPVQRMIEVECDDDDPIANDGCVIAECVRKRHANIRKSRRFRHILVPVLRGFRYMVDVGRR